MGKKKISDGKTLCTKYESKHDINQTVNDY